MTPATLLDGVLVLLVAERALELVVSTRNARRALAAGGVEAGRGHYPAMVLFHAAFLAACAVEPALWPRPWPAAAALAALALALAAQALRWWAVATLDGRWTTRIVVRPGAAPVTGGPYRWLAHPNYLLTAALATLGNAAILSVRIPAEERALGEGWARTFGRRAPLGRRP